MKKLTSIVLCLTIIGMAGMIYAVESSGAVKSDLLNRARETVGFVILNTNCEGELIVNVALKDGEANKTYGVDVKINRTDRVFLNRISTNRQSNGNLHGMIPIPMRLLQDDYIFVRLFLFDAAGDQIGTELITVPLKICDDF